MPARSFAAVTARLIWRGVIGLIGFWPGKSHTCGRAAFHHSRNSSSSRGDSITSRSRCPLPCSTRSIMLAVDVRHLQVRDLGHPKTRAVGDAESGLVLEAGRGFDKARHFLLAQDDGRLARLGHEPQRANEVGPFERHDEEESQRGDGGVDRPRADLLLRHVELISAKILARRRVRRLAEEGCEPPHVPDVVVLNLLLEPPRRHVVDQALTQRADGLLRHRKLLSRMGFEPHDLETGPSPGVSAYPSYALSARLPPLPRERFRSWAESEPTGVVPRRTGAGTKPVIPC